MNNRTRNFEGVIVSFAFLAIALTLLSNSVFAQDVRPDITIADFNGADYGEWKVDGQAFGSAPARGTLPNQMDVTGFEGAGLVNSYYGGDDTVGQLTSPEF